MFFSYKCPILQPTFPLQISSSLHVVEANVERKLKDECELKLEEAMNKNVLLVDQFLETEKGQELVRNRTLAYMQTNEGLDEIHAETEVGNR